MFQKLKRNFLGKSVDLYIYEIRIRNYKSFRDFSIIGLVFSITILLFGLLLRGGITFNTGFLILAIYFMLMIVFSEIIIKNYIEYIIPIFYCSMTPIMFMAILTETFLARQVQSITITIFICVLPLFILDKPWRVCLYITGVAFVYGVFSYVAKDFNLFIVDIIDLIASYILALGANFFILKDRLENVENYIKFRKKSERDVLTGIYNRGIGVKKINKLLQEKTYGLFIIFDVDNFKYINDNFGHIYGDEVLKEISKVVQRSFSFNDVFFRMGGDEFIIYCADSICELQYKRCLESLQEGIKAIRIPSINNIQISISIGGCIFNKGTVDYNELYRCSDRALYESKRNGKGRYTIISVSEWK